MSTSEDRLRQSAEDLQQHRRTTETEAARRKAEKSKRSVQRVRHVAKDYVKGTSALIAATRKRVHHNLHYWTIGQGFTLEVGCWLALQARLECDTWHVATRDRFANVSHHTYESDDLFLAAKDDLLEPLVTNALEALVSGREQPADDRGRHVFWR